MTSKNGEALSYNDLSPAIAAPHKCKACGPIVGTSSLIDDFNLWIESGIVSSG